MRAVARHIFALSFVPVLAAPAFADDCNLKQLASIDIVTASDGSNLIPVKIAGGDAFLRLELGAAFSAMAEPVAAQLQLQRSRLPSSVSANVLGQHATGTALAEKLQIGNAVFEKARFLVVPVAPQGADPREAGLLGLDVLEAVDVELDLSHGKLNLFLRDHCKGNVVYWNDPYSAIPIAMQATGNIVVHMALDDHPVEVGLNTTATHAFMPLSVATNDIGIDPHAPDLKPLPPNSVWYRGNAYTYPFKSLSIGGLAIQDPQIDILDDDPAWHCNGKVRFTDNGEHLMRCFGIPDVTLGETELRQLHLYFAFGEKMLYVTAADRP